MTSLIDTSIVTHEIEVSENELRDRLAREVCTSLGCYGDDNKLRPGIEVKVLRGEGRTGGYRVRVRRDMKQDTTPRLEGPK
ncbi:hypothetical protein G5V65_00105 [Rhodobacter sp. HX-7-19]|uniref:Uncharacterized protein n=1 Tax=Paragemmobacter kunshanensis TaxID=2583234 RepID=A0A6M1TNB8_9RHOB|nr:hypothetical protein [Rhodobacter kunshanensis]NGQ89280.1 hypothetical protein [Rhodobacter kunshanensis]